MGDKLKLNVHVTISGAVDAATQLQPVCGAITDALDRLTDDAYINFNVFASSEAAIEKKRKKDAEQY